MKKIVFLTEWNATEMMGARNGVKLGSVSLILF